MISSHGASGELRVARRTFGNRGRTARPSRSSSAGVVGSTTPPTQIATGGSPSRSEPPTLTSDAADSL